MPVEVNRIDTFQTRVFNSYVNLTRQDSTKYPAITTVRIEPSYFPPEALGGLTQTESLTSYTIYDQFALRVWSDIAPLSAK